ncbi:MAG: hypothetical protein JWR16_2688 [Nevskia sp.]|nr:hypothetical protein [Nevskia sp.]
MNYTNDTFSRHREAWELIPWVVNGTATPEQNRVVEQHLEDCGDCREELVFQSQLHAAMNPESTREAVPKPALDRLWQRIDGAAAVQLSRTQRRRQRRIDSGFARGLLALVIVEAIGVATLGGALWKRGEAAAHTPVYRTLSTSTETSQHATIHAVLVPSLAVGQLQTLLSASQLQIVGGPSKTGVYALAPMSSSVDTNMALAQLRADPNIRLAEPIDLAQRSPP